MGPEPEVLENLECADLGLLEMIRDCGLEGRIQAAEILLPMHADSAIRFYRQGSAQRPLADWQDRGEVLRSPKTWDRHPELRISPTTP